MTRTLTLLMLANLSGFAQQIRVESTSNVVPDAARIRPHLSSATGIGEGIVTHLADGGGWRTTIYVVNLSQKHSASYVLNFYDDNGKPLSLTFDSIGRGNQVKGTLPIAGSDFIRTTGFSSNI